jgi:hypothetical protein
MRKVLLKINKVLLLLLIIAFTLLFTQFELAKDKMSVLYYKLETENIKTICLIEQPNVHLFYYTAWTGTNNTMPFREDIYKLDKPLIEQLKKD